MFSAVKTEMTTTMIHRGDDDEHEDYISRLMLKALTLPHY